MNNPENNTFNTFVEVIIKRKLFIFVFVFFCVVITAIFSLLVDKVYQSTAVILLSPPAFRDVESDVGELAPKSLSVKTYKDILLNDSILSELREKLNLKDKRGRPILLDDLQERMSIKIDIIQETPSGIKYSPAMKLMAQANTPQKATELANTWAAIAEIKAGDIAQKSKEGSISFFRSASLFLSSVSNSVSFSRLSSSIL